MCGRFSFATSGKKIKETLGDNVEVPGELKISYNIAPTQDSYVITNDKPDLLQSFQWGLVPYWSKDGANSGKLINARMEGIETKPSFRTPIKNRRCLVLVDSFYEWKRSGGQKIPYRILMKNKNLMVMAGIWDSWTNGKDIIRSFSIITTDPNKEMSTVHRRMPLIFDKKDMWKTWLQDQPLPQVLDMLKIPEDNILDMYRVSTNVNSVINNTPNLHQEVPETPTLFD